MLDFQNISVHYGLQDVLADVSFRVNASERIGVVGPNGSGKSTLFKIILGELSTDHGELVIEGKPRIGSTRQHPEPDTPEETLLEYSMRGIPGFHELEARMRALEERLDSGDPKVLDEYGEVQTAFEHLGGYDLETRVKVALGGLGFSVEEFTKPFASFSGGWRMRAELSRVLASQPDLLLLDEPSNYLDLPAVDWLQKFLKQYRGTLMLISHDRYLLRTLTDIIVEVDAGTCTRYEGNLDWYLREREVRYQHLLQAKENQDHHREQLQRFVDRFRAQATKAAQAQSRQKLIDKIDEARIVLPKRYTQSGRLRLAPPPPSGIEMFRCENLFFSYDGVRNVLHDVTFNVARGDKVALIGYNGLGKSTLMRIIAGRRAPTSGKAVLGHNVVPGYLSQELAETIPPDLTVYRVAKDAWQGATNLSGEKHFRNQLGAGIRSFPGGYDYYCEKKAELQTREAKGARGTGGTAQPVAVPPDNAPRLTSKELRQQRAAERAKVAPRVKELKKKVAACEKKIEELQAALDATSEELFNPKPTTDFAEANRRVHTLQFEIDRYTEDWEKSATELEELQKGD